MAQGLPVSNVVNVDVIMRQRRPLVEILAHC
jgi:hypothetical protein